MELDDVKEIIENQIRSNMAIAHEGMTGKYGLGIGRIIRETYSNDMLTKMRALQPQLPKPEWADVTCR